MKGPLKLAAAPITWGVSEVPGWGRQLDAGRVLSEIARAGLVATELVAIRVKEAGLDDSVAVPMTVPARMMVYFAACEDPMEYTGRLFWAERELADLGIELDPVDA